MEKEKKRKTTVVVAGVGITVGLIGGVGYLAYVMKKKGLLGELNSKGVTPHGERDPNTGFHSFAPELTLKERLRSVIK